MARAHEMIRIEFPGRSTGPLRTMLLRLGVAVGLIAFVALLTYVGRDGYDDPEDESVTLGCWTAKPSSRGSPRCSRTSSP